jgi:hypothetical protein
MKRQQAVREHRPRRLGRRQLRTHRSQLYGGAWISKNTSRETTATCLTGQSAMSFAAI